MKRATLLYFFALLIVVVVMIVIDNVKFSNPDQKALNMAKNIENITDIDLPDILSIDKPEHPGHHSEEYMMDHWETSEYQTYTYCILYSDLLSENTLMELQQLSQKDQDWNYCTDENGIDVYHYSGKQNVDYFISEYGAKVRYYHDKEQLGYGFAKFIVIIVFPLWGIVLFADALFIRIKSKVKEAHKLHRKNENIEEKHETVNEVILNIPQQTEEPTPIIHKIIIGCVVFAIVLMIIGIMYYKMHHY